MIESDGHLPLRSTFLRLNKGSRDPAYPLFFLDAIRVKICDEGMPHSKAIQIALGRSRSGHRGGSQGEKGRRFCLEP